MSAASLPPNANLRQLRNQAKDLVKAHAARDVEAARRIRDRLPEWAGRSDDQSSTPGFP